jgi:uncharacterized membrane protein
MNSKTSMTTGKMVRMAVLVAILLIMAYTPLGYLKAGPVEITFLMIPVAIASVVVGPGAGALIGGIFGLTSFLQCFGASPFGAALLAINPIFTFILTMIPRILAGWLPGLIFRAMERGNTPKTVSVAVASLSAALFNTIFFVGFLLVLFGNTDYIRSFGENTMAIIGVLVTTNALIEVVVCTIVGAAVSRALIHFIPVKPK